MISSDTALQVVKTLPKLVKFHSDVTSDEAKAVLAESGKIVAAEKSPF